MFDYHMVREVTLYEVRAIIRTKYVPQHQQTSGFYKPFEIQMANRDMITYAAAAEVLVNGTDLTIEDNYSVSHDDSKVDNVSEIQCASRPPTWNVEPIGLVHIGLSLKSPYFPKITMFDFTVHFVSNRNIFVPKSLKEVNVAISESAKIKIIGPVMNLFNSQAPRSDNWFMIKFCQLIEILDPTAVINVNIVINQTYMDWRWDGDMVLDITPIITFYNSVTSLLHFREGEGESSAVDSSESLGSGEESPTSSISSDEFQVVDHY